jgi:membrane-anchored protein YejM (alkaline phosphatase superfamily)
VTKELISEMKTLHEMKKNVEPFSYPPYHNNFIVHKCLDEKNDVEEDEEDEEEEEEDEEEEDEEEEELNNTVILGDSTQLDDVIEMDKDFETQLPQDVPLDVTEMDALVVELGETIKIDEEDDKTVVTNSTQPFKKMNVQQLRQYATEKGFHITHNVNKMKKNELVQLLQENEVGGSEEE